MGQSTVQTDLPYTMMSIAQNIREILNTSYINKYDKCTSIYYISRDTRYATAIFTPNVGETKFKQNDTEDQVESDSVDDSVDGQDAKVFPSDIKNNKWIILPDTVLRAADFTPLYKRDSKSNVRIVNPQGLQYAAQNGLLELDVYVKSTDNTNASAEKQNVATN